MTASGQAPELPRWSVTDLHQSLDARHTDEAFWTASLDVTRGRISQYEEIAATLMLETE